MGHWCLAWRETRPWPQAQFQIPCNNAPQKWEYDFHYRWTVLCWLNKLAYSTQIRNSASPSRFPPNFSFYVRLPSNLQALFGPCQRLESGVSSIWFSIGCSTHRIKNFCPIVVHARRYCLSVNGEQPTSWGSLRAKLILAHLDMPKWVWTCNKSI